MVARQSTAEMRRIFLKFWTVHIHHVKRNSASNKQLAKVA